MEKGRSMAPPVTVAAKDFGITRNDLFEVAIKAKKETVVHTFTGNAQLGNYDGDNPVGDVMYDGQGHLFRNDR